jgi:hypothetical protein
MYCIVPECSVVNIKDQLSSALVSYRRTIPGCIRISGRCSSSHEGAHLMQSYLNRAMMRQNKHPHYVGRRPPSIYSTHMRGMDFEHTTHRHTFNQDPTEVLLSMSLEFAGYERKYTKKICFSQEMTGIIINQHSRIMSPYIYNSSYRVTSVKSFTCSRVVP